MGTGTGELPLPSLPGEDGGTGAGATGRPGAAGTGIAPFPSLPGFRGEGTGTGLEGCGTGLEGCGTGLDTGLERGLGTGLEGTGTGAAPFPGLPALACGAALCTDGAAGLGTGRAAGSGACLRLDSCGLGLDTGGGGLGRRLGLDTGRAGGGGGGRRLGLDTGRDGGGGGRRLGLDTGRGTGRRLGLDTGLDTGRRLGLDTGRDGGGGGRRLGLDIGIAGDADPLPGRPFELVKSVSKMPSSCSLSAEDTDMNSACTESLLELVLGRDDS